MDGSYVYKDGKIYKVPATDVEALSSPLMGIFEKRRFKNFLVFLSNYEKDKPSTYLKGKSMEQLTTKKLFEEYGLDPATMAFTGHAMALQRDDAYLEEPAAATVEAVQLYVYSLQRYLVYDVCMDMDVEYRYGYEYGNYVMKLIHVL